LPGELDGLGAASQIWAQLQIPVVYLSGYSDTQTLGQVGTPQPFLHLQKPFDEQALQETILQALALPRRDPPSERPGSGSA
jgi:CheY-like chemotaxis protein